MRICEADLRGKTIEEIAKEFPEGLLTERDLFKNLFEGARIYIIARKCKKLKATWKRFNYVYSFIDINDVVFKDKDSFMAEDYGKTWIAYCDYSLEKEKKEYMKRLKESMVQQKITYLAHLLRAVAGTKYEHE